MSDNLRIVLLYEALAHCLQTLDFIYMYPNDQRIKDIIAEQTKIARDKLAECDRILKLEKQL